MIKYYNTHNMSIPEKERNKEILTCIKVNEGENPELCYMSEKNKPEYLSPDYEGEQINNLNENVVSLNGNPIMMQH